MYKIDKQQEHNIGNKEIEPLFCVTPTGLLE